MRNQLPNLVLDDRIRSLESFCVLTKKPLVSRRLCKIIKRKVSQLSFLFLPFLPFLATTASLVASWTFPFLVAQLQPWISRAAPAVSLVGHSKPTISVLLPTLTFKSFLPALRLKVFDSLSKLTSFALKALEGQPAKTAPANVKDAINTNSFFILGIPLSLIMLKFSKKY